MRHFVEQNISQIKSLLEKYNPQETPGFELNVNLADADSEKIRATQFQDAIYHTIERFQHILEGKVDLIQTWKPDTVDDDVLRHCESLQVPIIDDKPSLLLHRLGENNSFALEGVLFNTSGAGKTRLVLEGLCAEWGFYFTCSNEISECGSADLRWVLDGSCNGYLRILGITVLNDKNPTNEMKNKNHADRCFLAVLCARLLVFKCLLAVYKEGGCDITPAKLRRIWLFAQLDTKLLGRPERPDLFLELTTLLCYVPTSTALLSIVKRIAKDCVTFIGTISSAQILYLVIDEAQVAVLAHSNSFLSDENEYRPALRAMLRTWNWQGSNINHILTGTSMNMAKMTGAISSTFGKTRHDDTIKATGSFIESDDQIVRYLNYYLPPSYLKTESGQELVSRAQYWLFGRQVFQQLRNRYVQYLIQKNFRCYHKFLTSYIRDITAFTPTDAEYWEGLEDPTCEPGSAAVMSLDFSRAKGAETRLIDEVERLVNLRLITGCMEFEKATDTLINIKLVECGFARYPGGQARSRFDEPLAYLAADDWIAGHRSRHKFFFSRLQNNTGRGNGFERYTAFCISHIFQNSTLLSDYFKFSDINKGKLLSGRTAKLVSCWIDSSKTFRVAPVVFPFENTSNSSRSSPSKMLGFDSKDPIDDLKWLRFEHNAPFLFPHNNFGPDLMFRLQLEGGNEELITVALQTKYRSLASGVTKKVLTAAFRSVTPHNFWRFKDTDVFFCHDKLPDLHLDTINALKSLPNRFSDYHTVIRGLFIFPAVWEGRNNDAITADTLAKINDRKRKKPIIKDSDRIHELFVMPIDPIEELTREMEPEGALARHLNTFRTRPSLQVQEDLWGNPSQTNTDSDDSEAQSSEMDTDHDESSVAHTATPTGQVDSLDIDDFSEAQSSETDFDDSQMPRPLLKRGRSEKQRPNKRARK
ncbi:hypothetical protein H0H92_002577 [Tricholoma furcatifolium]|nr:hypothetical protein H0H92_002577 [Tricholoma furcatifolium]